MPRSAIGLVLTLCLSLGGCASERSNDAKAAAELRESAAAAQQRQNEIEAADARDATRGEETATPTAAQAATSTASSGQTATGGGQLLAPADRASFTKLTEQLPGRQEIAVSGLGIGQRVFAAGDLRSGVAWSTSKVPVAMAAINAGTGSARDLRAAITESDNAAAQRLFDGLGSPNEAAAAATEQLRAAGDSRTVVQASRLRPEYTAFGQTTWAVTDQARFMAGIGCTDPGRQVVSLMQQTIRSQRWGIGKLSSNAALKGGWGPGITAGQPGGWLERQMGIARLGGRPVAIAIATSGGSHESATAVLSRLAQWAKTHVDTRGLPASAAC